MRFILFLIMAFGLCAPRVASANAERAKELQDFIQKEKPVYEKREAERRGLLEELDELNQSQNQVRNRIQEIVGNRQELQMALDNLSMEVLKHREVEEAQKSQFYKLMKLVNKIRRDGVVRFALAGGDLGEVTGRVRVLFRTLRMHSMISNQLQERSQRLAETEQRLSDAQKSAQFLLTELQEQEGLLKTFLARKKQVMAQVERKQARYTSAVKEWTLVSKELNQLFQSLESDRDPTPDSVVKSQPKRRSLLAPVDEGKLTKNFGRYVHPKFGTVTFHKGVEIEAEQQAPVHAVLDGVVEFEGWVRGLGNVLILHHGGGFYSLHAHLFKSLQHQGAQVKKGDSIGLVGDTGNSEKPSLYFELRENGKAVDPAHYLSANALKTLQG
ncbi:peptidoglycan DD-metalloendopeptidase family protein [bacterium]|nr:peptidoglycan DD-metalloendopeptidase family protein [bacterium]